MSRAQEQNEHKNKYHREKKLSNEQLNASTVTRGTSRLFLTQVLFVLRPDKLPTDPISRRLFQCLVTRQPCNLRPHLHDVSELEQAVPVCRPAQE